MIQISLAHYFLEWLQITLGNGSSHFFLIYRVERNFCFCSLASWFLTKYFCFFLSSSLVDFRCYIFSGIEHLVIFVESLFIGKIRSTMFTILFSRVSQNPCMLSFWMFESISASKATNHPSSIFVIHLWFNSIICTFHH
jgi:hypothetical protein